MENFSELKFETGKITICRTTCYTINLLNVRLIDGDSNAKYLDLKDGNGEYLRDLTIKYLDLKDENGEDLIFDNQDGKKIVPKNDTIPYDNIRYWHCYTRNQWW